MGSGPYMMETRAGGVVVRWIVSDSPRQNPGTCITDRPSRRMVVE